MGPGAEADNLSSPTRLCSPASAPAFGAHCDLSFTLSRVIPPSPHRYRSVQRSLLFPHNVWHRRASGPLLLLFPRPQVLSLPQRLRVMTSRDSYSCTQRLHSDARPLQPVLAATAAQKVCHTASLQPDSGDHPLRVLLGPHHIAGCAVTGSVPCEGRSPAQFPAGSPGNQQLSIKLGRKEEGKCFCETGHPFKHVRCISSPYLQHPDKMDTAPTPHFRGEASGAVAELGWEP